MAVPNRLSITTPISKTNESKSTEIAHVSSADLPGAQYVTHISNTPGLKGLAIKGQKTGTDDQSTKKFQYSQWHEFRRFEKGIQLKASRVRQGSTCRERNSYELEDEENDKLPLDLPGRQRKRQRHELENWDDATLVNFMHQDFHHGYQKKNLACLLNRLRRAVYLNLQDNELVSLASYSFPCCEYVNLNSNYFTSFKQLPSMPHVKYLTIQDNDISGLDGLSVLCASPLQELFLTGNPVSYKTRYRYLVLSTLPHLKSLDGIARQKEDLVAPDNMVEEDATGKSCVIS